jgi:TonB family protein
MTATTCAQPDRPPAIVRAASAAYPGLAAQQRIGGVVRVRVTLDATGRVTAATVVDAPNAVLERPSLDAARASAFRAALRHCARVASDYEFRVLFDPSGPSVPLPRPAPLPSAAPAPPRPAPALGQPWNLSWSVSSLLGFSWTTLASTGAYETTSPYLAAGPGGASCSGRATPRVLARVARLLTGSAPQLWHDYYGVAYEEPSPTPSPAGTPAPPHDTIALLPPRAPFMPAIGDLPESRLELSAANGTYATSFVDAGKIPQWRTTAPEQIQALVRELSQSVAPCPQRRPRSEERAPAR